MRRESSQPHRPSPSDCRTGSCQGSRISPGIYSLRRIPPRDVPDIAARWHCEKSQSHGHRRSCDYTLHSLRRIRFRTIGPITDNLVATSTATQEFSANDRGPSLPMPRTRHTLGVAEPRFPALAPRVRMTATAPEIWAQLARAPLVDLAWVWLIRPWRPLDRRTSACGRFFL